MPAVDSIPLIVAEAAYLQAIDSLGGSRRNRFRHVIWPSVLPRLLGAVRITSATALEVLVFAETFFTELGLVYYIVNSWLRLDYLSMYAGGANRMRSVRQSPAARRARAWPHQSP